CKLQIAIRADEPAGIAGGSVKAYRKRKRNEGCAIIAMVACVGVPQHDCVRRSRRSIGSANTGGRARERGRLLGMNRIWLHRRLGDALLGDVSLRPREWDRADGDERKQVKRAWDQMRFDVGV